MKKILISLLLIFIGNLTFAGHTENSNNHKAKSSTCIVSGKVVDKTTGEEIAGAEIKIDNKTVYTDLNGKFCIAINSGKTEAVVKYISYNDTKINVDPFSYNTIEIQLESK